MEVLSHAFALEKVKEKQSINSSQIDESVEIIDKEKHYSNTLSSTINDESPNGFFFIIEIIF